MFQRHSRRAEAYLFTAAIGVFVLSAWGCGPVGYVHHVVLKAKTAVAQAETNEAAKHAPYEYYGAVAYLKQARIRAGFGDLQTAVKYGKKSTKMAKKAVKLTKKRLEEKEDIGVSVEGLGGSDQTPRTAPRAAEVPRQVGGSGGDTETPPATEDTKEEEKKEVVLPR